MFGTLDVFGSVGEWLSMDYSPISPLKRLQMVGHATMEGASDRRTQTNEDTWRWGVYERSQEDSWLGQEEWLLIILYLTSCTNKMCFCLETSLLFSSASIIFSLGT